MFADGRSTCSIAQANGALELVTGPDHMQRPWIVCIAMECNAGTSEMMVQAMQHEHHVAIVMWRKSPRVGACVRSHRRR